VKPNTPQRLVGVDVADAADQALVEPEDTVNTGDAGGPLTAAPEDLTAS